MQKPWLGSCVPFLFGTSWFGTHTPLSSDNMFYWLACKVKERKALGTK
jgi:hypothetical protein